MTHVIRAELDFVAGYCGGRWDSHDAGVVHEDIET